MKITSSLAEQLLEEIDALASAEHQSRSKIVLEAVRHYVEKRRRIQLHPGALPTVQAAARAQDEIARVVAGAGENSTEIIRFWRDRDARPV